VSVTIENEVGLTTPEQEQLLERCIAAALQVMQCVYPIEVTITLTDDEQIQQINAEYRGIDRSTDVLSFPMLDFSQGQSVAQPGLFAQDVDPQTGELLLGDIVISIPTAQRQAEEYGHSVDRELSFLTVHGMMHLMGHDHETPEQQAPMRAAEEAALALVGQSR